MFSGLMETLSDLVFDVRDSWAGRADLLSIRRHGRVEQVSTSQLIAAAHGLALALEERGVRPGDRVALWAENCPEWHVVDFACHLLGAASVPLYPTLAPPAVAYVLKNSGASWMFYSDAEKGAVLRQVADSLSRRSFEGSRSTTTRAARTTRWCCSRPPAPNASASSRSSTSADGSHPPT